jgi:hypothetical protein
VVCSSSLSLLVCASGCSPLLGLDKNYALGSAGNAGAAAGGLGGSAGGGASAGGSSGSNSGGAGLTVVQSAPFAAQNTEGSCSLPNVRGGNALVVVVKYCAAATDISVFDSQGASYGVAPQTTALLYFASFAHPAGSTTITVSGNNNCFLLLNCMEVSGGVRGFVAGGEAAYGSISVSGSGSTSSLDASASNAELLIGSGEVEGQTALGALSEYGSGGGTPTALQQVATTTQLGGAQMWSGFQVISDSKQYGLQRTLTASAVGTGAVVVLSTAP